MLFLLNCLHTPGRGNIHAFNSPGSSDWEVPLEVKGGEKVGSSITVARVVTQKVGLWNSLSLGGWERGRWMEAWGSRLDICSVIRSSYPSFLRDTLCQDPDKWIHSNLECGLFSVQSSKKNSLKPWTQRLKANLSPTSSATKCQDSLSRVVSICSSRRTEEDTVQGGPQRWPVKPNPQGLAFSKTPSSSSCHAVYLCSHCP